MADKKISQLPAATTPLAGTEVLPIVQSGTTDKVSVADLTAGRAISATELTLTTGNLVIGTSGKGIDFSATPAAGMTSQLLSAYEEGTWTPNQGAGLTVVGTFTSNGSYTQIGRMVTIQGQVKGSTSIACSAFGIICSNLPFSSGSKAFAGVLYGGSPTVGGVTANSVNNLYSVEAVSAGTEITFTVILFV